MERLGQETAAATSARHIGRARVVRVGNRARLVLDVALLAALLVAFAPAQTGITVHEWLSLAIVVPTLVHLIINWEWVVRVARRILTKARLTSTVNLAVDTLLFVSTVTVMVSGLMVSQAIASTFGLVIVPMEQWHVVHSGSAKTTMILTLVHLALHARWFARTFEGLLPARSGEPAPGAEGGELA